MAGDPDRLAATLKAAADKVSDLTDAHTVAARVVLSAATPKTPRRTGRLAAGLRSVVGPHGFTIAAAAPYAAPVHAARPWVTDAIAATTDDQVDVYRGALVDIVNTIEA